jgi:hypothetical protein
MTEKVQRPRDGSGLLDDIRYVNQVCEEEIQKLREQMRQRIGDAELPDDVSASLIEEVSAQLGRLGAKVKMTDQIVKSLKTERKKPSQAPSVTIDAGNRTDPSDTVIKAAQLAGTRNMLPMESADGIDFCWSGADPEISISARLDRSKKLGMQIRLFALIKPEYSKQMQVMIDGAHVKHHFAAEGRLFVVSCVLPPADKTGPTEIRIILPATHCPTDIGAGLDGRTLGIAVNEIRFGKPESGFNHLLRRLKLK